jgi:fructose-specific component phosphotransferase system IIB-like protein
VTAIQETFGPRVERILGTGGGLLVVLDRVADGDKATAERLSREVPVAVIEPRTLHGLRRIGGGTLLGEARTHFEATAGGAAARVPPLLAIARERLTAAEALLSQHTPSATAQLLATALLAAAAHRAGLDRPPAPDQAVVWLYGEALPKGWLSPEDAGLITRAVALQQAPAVPDGLAESLLADTRAFLAGP